MQTMKETDYIYCEDCEEYCDFWKYDHLLDTGHNFHNWRYVNAEELKNCMKDCIDNDCFNEEMI